MEKNLKRVKIEDRIDILEKFIKKYPVVWLNKSLGAFNEWDKLADLYSQAKMAKSPEEYAYKKYHELLNKICTKAGVSSTTRFDELKRIKEQLEFCQESFEYIARRKYDGALSVNLEKKMKKMGAGGIFGSPIEDFCKKYNVSKYDVGDIILKYGSLNKFRAVYIQYMINSFCGKKYEKPYLGKLEHILVSGFDIASPDLILRKTPVIKLCNDILGDRNWFVDSNGLEMQLNRNMLCLKERTADILMTCYRNSENESMIEICRQYGLSRTRGPQIRDNAIIRLQKHPSCKLLMEEADRNQLDSREMEVFITLFFQKHDVFFNEESRLDNKTKETLLELHKNGVEKKRHREEREKAIQSQKREKQFELQRQQIRDNKYRKEKARAIEELLSTIKLYDLGFNIYFANNLSNVSVAEWLQQPHDELSISISEEVENKISQLVGKIENVVEKNMIRESVNYEIEPIEKLNLSVRAYNALKRNGIITVGELLKLSDLEITDMRFLGVKSYEEIIEVIHGLGLRFAHETDNIETVEYVFKCDTDAALKEVLEKDKILVPIENLGLSNRAYNALKRASVNSVQSLIDMPFEAIKDIENLGEKSFNEIVEKVRNLGYEFNNQSGIDEIDDDKELEIVIRELKKEYIVLNERIKEHEDVINRIVNMVDYKTKELGTEEAIKQMEVLVKMRKECSELKKERNQLRKKIRSMEK